MISIPSCDYATNTITAPTTASATPSSFTCGTSFSLWQSLPPKNVSKAPTAQRADARNHVRLKIHVLFSPKNSLSHANGVTEGVKKQAASPQRTQQPAWYHLISHSPKRECLFALYRARPLPSKATFGTRSLQVALQPVGDSL